MKVHVDLSYELNGDRIVGPTQEDKLFFIKDTTMIKNSDKN